MSRQALLHDAFRASSEQDQHLQKQTAMDDAVLAMEHHVQQFDDIDVILNKLESYSAESHLQISQESESPELKTFWEKLMILLRAIWARFQTFLETNFNATKLTQIKAKRTRYRYSTVEGRFSLHGKVPMGSLTKLLSFKGVPAGSEETMDIGLKELRNEMKFLMDKYIPFVEHIGQKLSEVFTAESVHPTDGPTFLATLNAAMLEYDIYSLHRFFPRTYSLVDGEYPLNTVKRGPYLLGDRTLIFVNGSARYDDKEDQSAIAVAAGIQDSKVVLHLLAGKDGAPGSMDVAPQHNLEDWITFIEELLQSCQDFTVNSYQRRALAHAKTIENALSIIAKNATEDNREYHRAFRYSQAYAVWVSSPSTDMISHVNRVCDAALSMINRQIAFYNENKK